MKHKTSELEGDLLDVAAGKASGVAFTMFVSHQPGHRWRRRDGWQ